MNENSMSPEQRQKLVDKLENAKLALTAKSNRFIAVDTAREFIKEALQELKPVEYSPGPWSEEGTMVGARALDKVNGGNGGTIVCEQPSLPLSAARWPANRALIALSPAMFEFIQITAPSGPLMKKEAALKVWAKKYGVSLPSAHYSANRAEAMEYFVKKVKGE